MGPEREYAVAVFVAVAAILIIVGGYASFSGLAVRADPLDIELYKGTFSQSDVFDANIVVNPATFLADESLVIYLDDKPSGIVALKQYLDENGYDYGSDAKNAGTNNVEIITMLSPFRVSLADYISLDKAQSGSTHKVRVEFSRGDAAAEATFAIE
ncbi:hypothetical protein KY363_00655 [Candidatus Woesearchaeota archaeon]|nr:hypothetical protein [Candidatus Woesearchaeota archaeon]